MMIHCSLIIYDNNYISSTLLHLTDSIVQESMRLASGVFMVRYITKDTEFTLTDGTTHLMRAGDRVAMYPPAIHKDPEIFENPLVSFLVGYYINHIYNLYPHNVLIEVYTFCE